jgi:imidazolonepropionase-like amidohydrolase
MKHFKTGIAMLVLLGIGTSVHAQAVPAQAFTRVTVHLADGTSIPNASIVWRNGVIEAVGTNVTLPFDARVTNGGDSLHVYPGFIDGLATWGAPEVPRPSPTERIARPAEPGYERAGIQPERSVMPLLKKDAPEFNLARNNGFTLAGIAPQGLMLPGQLSVFQVKGDETANSIYRRDIAPKASLAGARGVYPGTIMGVLSRYRQLFNHATVLKARQTANEANVGRDAVLEALYPVMEKKTPFYFIADDREDIGRVIKLSDELGFRFVLVSGKDAGYHAAELAKRGVPVLASIDLTARPDTAKIAAGEHAAWHARQMETWTSHVRNIRTLLDAGVTVGYASNGLKPADVRKNLDLLISDGGLTEADVVKMMTSSTATILGLNTVAGDIRTGRLADLVVTTKPLATKNTKILYTVTGGQLTEIKSTPSGPAGPRGRMPQ